MSERYSLDDGLELVADLRKAVEQIAETLECASTVEHLTDLLANLKAARDQVTQIRRDVNFGIDKVIRAIEAR